MSETTTLQATCCIEEDTRKEFGGVVRSGWAVWDTTVNPPGSDVVDCFPPEWERKEVEEELAKRGFQISPENEAAQHRPKM